MRHRSAYFENLVVGGDQLVELQRGVRIDGQVANLVLVHVYVHALIMTGNKGVSFKFKITIDGSNLPRC